jgi:hypothetical protein
MTSTDTSRERLPAVKRGSGVVRALPAFSYAPRVRPSAAAEPPFSLALTERPPDASPVSGAPR